MKRLLAASVALIAFAVGPAGAADMPLKAPPPVVAAYDWSGFYIGLNGGYSWGRSSTGITFFNSATGVPIVPPAGSITSANFNLNGGIFGGQIGYNIQNGRLVYGIEADLQWSGERGSSNFLCAATATGGVCLPGLTFLPAGATGSALSLSQSLDWFGTVRGRLGLTVTPTVLAYVTGGLAYGGIRTNGTLSGFTPGGVATAIGFSNTTTKAGWTIGGGLEARLFDRWTGKAEYLYADYGTVTGTGINTAAGIGATFSSRITDNVFRVGVNYHFGGPIATRY